MNLAIFDLDNTLLAGDSDLLWGEFLVEKGLVEKDFYRLENQRFYEEYNRGTLDIEEYLGFSLKPLTEHLLDDLLKWRAEFIQTKIQPIILKKGIELIQKHKMNNDQLLIITATNRFVTEPISSLLGVPNLIATDPEIVDGKYTGKVSGVPCFQSGKVTRLNTWLSQNNLVHSDSCFYSDSHNDIPLLEKVTRAVVVDGDEKLKTVAKMRNWEMMSLR